MAETGWNSRQIAALNLNDFDPVSGVLNAAGGPIPLSNVTLGWVLAWIRIRPHNRHGLFTTIRRLGRRLTYIHVEALIPTSIHENGQPHDSDDD
jgi:hypothetical protein